MKFSYLIKAAIPLLIFFESCQAQTPATPITIHSPVPVITQTPNLTPTPDPEIISSGNASQITEFKFMNKGIAYGPPMYSPDGKWLYQASTVGIYAFETSSYPHANLLATIPLGTQSGPDQSITLSADGKFLGIWDDVLGLGGNPKPANLETPSELTNQLINQQTKFSVDSSLIARHYNFVTGRGIASHLIAVWNLADGKLINTFEGEDMQLSADNRLIAVQLSLQDKSFAYKKYVYVYDLNTAKRLGDWLGERPAFLSNNNLVVESDDYVRIFDPKTGGALHAFEGKFASFSPDEKSIVLLSHDQINMYNLSNNKFILKLENKFSSIDQTIFQFSADGKIIAGYALDSQCCGGFTQYMSIWQATDGKLITKLNKKSRLFNLSPDGKTIAVEQDIFRTSDGSLIAHLNEFGGPIQKLTFTSNGQQIIVPIYQDIFLYQVDSGQISIVPSGADSKKYLSVLDAAVPYMVYPILSSDKYQTNDVYSPDGKFVATGGKSSANIWSVSDKKSPFTIQTDSEVTRLAFSPNNQILAIGLWDSSVQLWDLNGKQKIFTIPPRTKSKFDYVGGLAFSPDGKLLAIGLEDGTLRLYKIKTQ